MRQIKLIVIGSADSVTG